MIKKSTAFFLILISTYTGLLGQQRIINGLISEGIKLHDKGNYIGAIDLYKKALLVNNISTQANYEIASTYLTIKDYKNAIKYSDNVIAANVDYMDQAYILKGAALDNLGKQLEAIKTYEQGLKKFTKNYLLYYNLALTSFSLKDYKTADGSLEKALTLNPSHASSHFLLALSMRTQGNRVKGILALYNFLLLEPNSKRTASAVKTLEAALKKSNEKISLAMPTKKENDEFYTAELMLALLESSKANESNKTKSAAQLFSENTNSFFEILGAIKKEKKDFWWSFYVDYFYTIASNNLTEAFCYYITQVNEDVYKEWLKNNLQQLESFLAWQTKYLHKF